MQKHSSILMRKKLHNRKFQLDELKKLKIENEEVNGNSGKCEVQYDLT